MRQRHFEELRPVCPVCLHQRGEVHPVRIASVVRQQGECIVEGMLHCSNAQCLREFPVIDGIPLLVPDIRSFVANNLLPLLARDDLSADVLSLIGDCCGPGSQYDADRLHLSSYAWDHYGDLDPDEEPGEPRPGSALRVLDAGLALLENAEKITGPVLDLGCSAGRTTFALTGKQRGLVLGIDMNPAMLRLTSRVLHQGQVAYDRKRIGLVFDRREFDVHLADDRVDFWACDALALPFAPGTFNTAVALNLLDCAPAPRDLLAGVRRVLRAGGAALFTTPFDWSSTATPVEAWIGGHSQRGDNRGAAEPLLRTLLTSGAHPQAVDNWRIVGEAARLPWQVRVHDRSSVAYAVHAVALRTT